MHSHLVARWPERGPLVLIAVGTAVEAHGVHETNLHGTTGPGEVADRCPLPFTRPLAIAHVDDARSMWKLGLGRLQIAFGVVHFCSVFIDRAKDISMAAQVRRGCGDYSDRGGSHKAHERVPQQHHVAPGSVKLHRDENKLFKGQSKKKATRLTLRQRVDEEKKTSLAYMVCSLRTTWQYWRTVALRWDE